MTRHILRLTNGLLLFALLLVTVSKFIGHSDPPNATAVFLFNESAAVTRVTWVDPRTGVQYQRRYPQTESPADATGALFSAIPSCQMPVLQAVNGDYRLAFLNLTTGLIRTYPGTDSFDPWFQNAAHGHYTWLQSPDSAFATPLTRVLLNLETGTFITRRIQPGSFTRVVWSPDARALVEMRVEPSAAVNYNATTDMIPAFLVNPDTGAELPLPDALVNRVRWSPDSQQVALVSPDGLITVLDTNAQPRYQLAVFNDIWQINWLDNRHLMLFARSVPDKADTTTLYRLVVWSLDDDRLTYRPVELPIFGPTWFSPAWSYVVYFPTDDAPVMLDLRTGETVTTLQGREWDQFDMHWSADERYLAQVLGAGTLTVFDTVTHRSATFPLQAEVYNFTWVNAPGAVFGYYDFSQGRLGRIRPTAAGLVMETIDRPGASYGAWCLPEADA